ARRARDREGAVEISPVLRRRTREVDADLLAVDLNRDANRELAVDRLHDVLRGPPPVRQPGNRRTHHPLRVRVQLVHRSDDALPSATLAELIDAPFGEAMCSDLRAQVTATLVGVTRVRDEQAHDLVAER